MAVTKQILSFTSNLKQFRDTLANATAENDINGGAATLYGIKVNNSSNVAACFVKLWNNALPTVGTTVPDITMRVAGQKTRSVLFPKGIAFGTAISFAVVTEGGGTAGTTGPTNAVEVDILAV